MSFVIEKVLLLIIKKRSNVPTTFRLVLHPSLGESDKDVRKRN